MRASAVEWCDVMARCGVIANHKQIFWFLSKCKRCIYRVTPHTTYVPRHNTYEICKWISCDRILVDTFSWKNVASYATHVACNACLVYLCYIMYVNIKNEFSQLAYNCQFSVKITHTIQIFGNDIPVSYWFSTIILT